jgi:DNA polymerase-3 subunit chi
MVPGERAVLTCSPAHAYGADGAPPSDWTALGDLARVVLLFDGRDEATLARARAAWKDAKAGGHDVTYWKEQPNGKFEKQG